MHPISVAIVRIERIPIGAPTKIGCGMPDVNWGLLTGGSIAA